MVHQHFRLVPPFTVAENVILGDHRGEGKTFLVHPRHIERRVAELGERYRIAVDPRARVWQLSLGEQQRVEILKALYREARILILDEPTAVLTPQEADSLFETLRDDGRRGAHRDLHLAQAARGEGRLRPRHGAARRARPSRRVATADSTPQSLAALMVGRELDGRRARAARDAWPATPALELDDVWASATAAATRCAASRSHVRAGEIVARRRRRRQRPARAGRGRHRDAAADARAVSRSTASRCAAATRARRSAPASRTCRRTGCTPGVAPSLSIGSNVVLKSYRDRGLAAGPLLRLGAIRERAAQLIQRYDVRGGDAAAAGAAALGRQPAEGRARPRVLRRAARARRRLADARARRVGDRDGPRTTCATAARAAWAILLISEDLDEILALADRIVVMYEGGIVGELDAGRGDRRGARPADGRRRGRAEGRS